MATKIEKAVFVKNNGNYIHPETCANMVWYDDEHTISLKDKIDEMLEEMDGMSYVPIKIESFTVTPATIEKGDIINSLTFNATFNNPPKNLTLTIAGEYNDIDFDPTSKSFSYTISNKSITGTISCKLAISDKRGADEKIVSIGISNRYYYGLLKLNASNKFNLLDLSNYLATSKTKTVNMTVTEEDSRVYYCFPITSMNNTVGFVHNNLDLSNIFKVKGITYLETEYDISNNKIEYINDGNIIENFTSSDIINTAMNNEYKTKTTYIIYESLETYDRDIIGFNIK